MVLNHESSMTLRFWAEECPYTILYICYAHYDSDPVSPLIPSPITHMSPPAVLPSYSGTLTSTVSQIRFLPRKQLTTRGSRWFTQLQVSGLCLFFFLLSQTRIIDPGMRASHLPVFTTDFGQSDQQYPTVLLIASYCFIEHLCLHRTIFHDTLLLK